jgi:hypothetical protein
MVGGLWDCFRRHGLPGLTCIIAVRVDRRVRIRHGGSACSIGIAGGWRTNWHSVLRQSYGFINGIGLAVALFWIARRTRKLANEPPPPQWTRTFATAFVLLVITYLNLRRGPETWSRPRPCPTPCWAAGGRLVQPGVRSACGGSLVHCDCSSAPPAAAVGATRRW